MLTINDLHKAYGANRVLRGINIDFSKPGISAVLGPNGSGKTTLLKCALGLVIPDGGSIEVDGKKVKGEWTYRKDLSYLPQIARFPENLSPRDLIRMLHDLRPGATRTEALIERFDLEEHMDKRLADLSGGNRQKVNIVLAFMYDTQLLILDEPTSGLDPLAMIELKALLREERAAGKTLLLTTHIMGLVEDLADEIVFLLEGVVHYRGSMSQLLSDQHSNTVEEAIATLLRQGDKKGKHSGTSSGDRLTFGNSHNTAKEPIHLNGNLRKVAFGTSRNDA